MIQERFISIWNDELDRLPFHDRPTNAKRLNEEISIFSHVARCVFNGRNIFHLQPELSTLLRTTDVEDVEWQSIKLPYSSFYLWFGPQKDWPLGASHYVDGAYIESGGGHDMQITLTSVASVYASEQSQNFVRDYDPYYYAPFTIPSDEDTVGKTLKTLLERDPSFKTSDLRNESAVDVRLDDGAVVAVPSLPKEQSGWYEAALEHQSNLPVFMQALRLVINGLCFLSASPDDTVLSFPQGAIQDLHRDQEHTTDAQILGHRETKQLHRLGYTEIHFCGKKFVQAAQHEIIGTGGEMPPHRRRAFWRNQTCGPRNSERRPKWIKPTVVRRDKLREDEDAPGHTYIV